VCHCKLLIDMKSQLTMRSRGALIELRNNVPYCGSRNPWEETRVFLAANPYGLAVFMSALVQTRRALKFLTVS
jgi:hypothetical protein